VTRLSPGRFRFATCRLSCRNVGTSADCRHEPIPKNYEYCRKPFGFQQTVGAGYVVPCMRSRVPCGISDANSGARPHIRRIPLTSLVCSWQSQGLVNTARMCAWASCRSLKSRWRNKFETCSETFCAKVTILKGGFETRVSFCRRNLCLHLYQECLHISQITGRRNAERQGEQL
jgi:hypothetical protein